VDYYGLVIILAICDGVMGVVVVMSDTQTNPGPHRLQGQTVSFLSGRDVTGYVRGVVIEREL
jgi:hypothetical protein